MASSAVPLYPYQSHWIKDDARFKIGLWSRQVGKTFASTLEIVLDSLQRKSRWVILSRGERQAREAIEEGVKKHCQALQAGFEALEYKFDGTFQVLEVVLPNGSRISALPANPDTARGFSANVLLDEFAFHQDSRKIWQALFPVISAGHKLRVISTPNGKGNKFYELMTGSDQVWSRHRVDIYEAVAQGLPRDIDALRQALADEDAWQQEYLLDWLDSASAWLGYELISGCESPLAGIPSQYQGEPVFIGNDLARRGDLWVAWVLEPIADVLWTREVVVLRRAPFAEQEQAIANLFARYRVARLCLDQTGMGEKVVEDYQARWGSYTVEGVLFTGPNKLLLANSIKQRFEERRVRIPAGDQQIRADLHKVRKMATATGAIRFDADSDSQGHADRFWALSLACYAAETGYSAPVDYQAGDPVEAAAAYGLPAEVSPLLRRW